MSEIEYGLMAIRFIVGFALVYFAAKAFKKTRYPPMGLLVIGFTLLVIGDPAINGIAAGLDPVAVDVIGEGIEISGFAVLILAVLKS